jgi:hypothetical protein
MPNRRLVRVWLALAPLILAPSAGAELEAWDQVEVTRLAKDLERATEALEETFVQQSTPKLGSPKSESYYRLRHRVRVLRSEAHVLARSLEDGNGREQTEWLYEILMSNARSARYDARDVFVANDVGKRAAAVRGVLNQLGPYYDPDFHALAPHPNIEPSPSR